MCGPGYSKMPFCVMENSDIHSVAGLRGKTVAVNAFGTITDLVLRVALKNNGMDPRRDVRIVEISFPSIGPALRQDRIQGGILPVPFGEIELSKGGNSRDIQRDRRDPDFSSVFRRLAINFWRNLRSGPGLAGRLCHRTALLYEPGNRAQPWPLLPTSPSRRPPYSILSFSRIRIIIATRTVVFRRRCFRRRSMPCSSRV